MKNRIILIFSFTFAFNLFSQFELNTIDANAYFSVIGGKLKNESFIKFADSYTEYQKNGGQNVLKDLKGFNYSIGYQCGIRVSFVSLNFIKIQGQSTCEFDNGTRVFKNTIYTPLNVGFPFSFYKKRIQVHPKGGLAQSYIQSYFVYTNGIESLGNETLISGTYSTFVPGLYLGLDLSYRQRINDSHFIEVGLSINKMFAKNIFYQDNSHGRTFSIDYNYNTNLPLDVEGYFTSDAYTYGLSRSGYVDATNTFNHFFLSYVYKFNLSQIDFSTIEQLLF